MRRIWMLWYINKLKKIRSKIWKKKKLDRLVQTAGKKTIVDLLEIKTADCELELTGKTYIKKGVVHTYTEKSIAYKLYAVTKIRTEGFNVIYNIVCDIIKSKQLHDDVRYQAKLYIMWIDNQR